jgi:hypothetical protein
MLILENLHGQVARVITFLPVVLYHDTAKTGSLHMLCQQPTLAYTRPLKAYHQPGLLLS